MNELQVFENIEFGQIRIIEIEGKEYFVASDVAKALGYTNTSKAISDHCKGVTKRYILTNGGNQELNVIQKGDVVRLITKSKLPEAEKFELWVFDEVIPTVLEHGGYLTPQKIEDVLNNPDTIIQLATILKNEKEKVAKLELDNAKKDQLIGELKPKADYTNWILQNKGLVTITQIAKDYGMSGTALNKTLHELKVQYRQSGQWLLYKDYHDKGYAHSETVEITHTDGTKSIKMITKWAQKGRLFLYELLKSEQGLLPVIERERWT